MIKSAVVNKETTIVENIIMADPSDPWFDTNSFLVLVPDNLPVNFNDTYVEPNFYNSDGNIIEPIPIEPIEEIIDVVEETTTEPTEEPT